MPLLDQVGLITRKVEDAITLLEVVSGKDDKDSTCAPYPPFGRSEIPAPEEIVNLKWSSSRVFSFWIRKSNQNKNSRGSGETKGRGN